MANHDQMPRRRAAATGPDLSRLPHQLTPTDTTSRSTTRGGITASPAGLD